MRVPRGCFCRTERCGHDGEFACVSTLCRADEPDMDPVAVPQPITDRIVAILRERYEPHAAERVALRIVESIQAGDRIGEQLCAVPISATKVRTS